MYIAYNSQVQPYLTYFKPSKKRKLQLIDNVQAAADAAGMIYEQAFPNKKEKVLDEILYNLSASGICKIGAAKLAEKVECTERTVYAAVKSMKETGMFVVARLANRGPGKYIFVDKTHENFEAIMKDVFKLNKAAISELNSGIFSGRGIIKKPDISTIDDKNGTSTNLPDLSLKQASNNNKSIYSIQSEIEKAAKDFKTIEEQRQYLSVYATNPLQRDIFEFIASMPNYPTAIVDNAAIIALRTGSDATRKEFNAAIKTINSMATDIQLRQVYIENVPAAFTAAYIKALGYKATADKRFMDKLTAASNQSKDEFDGWNTSNVEKPTAAMPFYNWLDKKDIKGAL